MVRAPMGRYGMIPSAAYIDKRLTAAARDILGVIAAHGNAKANGWLYLYQRNIADTLGVDIAGVRRWIAKLVEYGYLQKKPSYLKSGAQSYNWYRVRLDFDLPEQFSRLALAPDGERADADPPLIVGSPPPGSYDHPPLIVGSPPIYKDERGNFNGETLTEVTHSPPVLENLPSGDRLTPQQIRIWPWLYGVPVRSRRLRAAHVERATNAYEQEMREEIAAARVPEFRLWEKAHHWPRGVMPSDSEREREYRTFAAIVAARIAETHPQIMEALTAEV